MKCRKAQRKLSTYVDGELAPDVRAGIETHVASCARCAEELEHIRRLAAALDAVPGAPAPLGFPGRVRARAEQGAQAVLRSPGAMRLLRATSVAALMVGVALGGLMGRTAADVRIAQTVRLEGDLVTEIVGVEEPGWAPEAFLIAPDQSE